MRLALAVLLHVLLAAPALAQRAGSLRAGFTFGLPSKTGLSLRYYPVNGVGIEVHGHVSGLLHTGADLGVGAALHLHPNPDGPLYLVANYTRTLFARPGPWPPAGGDPGTSALRDDVALGAGVEGRGRRDSLYYAAALGLNVGVRRVERVPGPAGRLVHGPTRWWRLRPYVEMGVGGQLPPAEAAREH